MENTCHSSESSSCRIFSGQDVFPFISEMINSLGKKKEKIFILVDSNTRTHCLPILLSNVPALKFSEILEMEEGEQHKNIRTTIQIWQKMNALASGRNTILINLGGGVVTDLGGFTASTFKRGISYINIPTSLLGMVDASIGGKTGINDGLVKNQIGTFKLPAAVFIFPGFLSTLSQYDLKSGFGELLKYGLIADLQLWKKIKGWYFESDDNYDLQKLESLINRAVKIKVKIVNGDFYEEGQRAILNFGHTVGHAFESLSYIRSSLPLSHGHAIGLGMICASYISTKVSGLALKYLEDIIESVLNIFEYFKIEESDITLLFEYLLNDKKRFNGELKLTLIESPGKAIYGCTVTPHLIRESLVFYMNLQNATARQEKISTE